MEKLINNREMLGIANTVCDKNCYMIGDTQIDIKVLPEAEVIYGHDISHKTPNEVNKDIKVEVVDSDSLSYLYSMTDEERKSTLLLNFACGYIRGGHGSHCGNTQEEDLIQRTNLMKALTLDISDNYYGYNNMIKEQDYFNVVHNGYAPVSCLLCRNISCFADADHSLLNEPIVTDIITAAAPYAPTFKFKKFNKKKYNINEIIELIFVVAEMKGYKNLILGAFGCGAFKNDPNIVANIFKQEIEQKKYNFDKVIFPIPNTGKSETNYKVFKSILLH